MNKLKNDNMVTIFQLELLEFKAGLPENFKYPVASFVDTGFFVIRIHADNGLVGIGEPSPYLENKNSAVRRKYKKHISNVFQGKTIIDAWELCKQKEYTNQSVFPYSQVNALLAGVSQAVLDIIGQLNGLSCSRLLVEEQSLKTSIPIYASGGMIYEGQSDELLVKELLEVKKQGYKAWKFRPAQPLGLNHQERSKSPPPFDLRKFISLSKKLRDVAGDDFNLMVDFGCRIKELSNALWVCDALFELGFYMVEEPIRRDLRLYSELMKHAKVKISSGEALFSVEQCMSWIESKAISIIQPDMNLLGFNDGQKLIKIVKDHGIECIPHNWANGISNIANAHLAVAMGNSCPYLEMNITYNPLRTLLINKPLNMKNGQLILNEGSAGLGVQLNEKLIDEFVVFN